MNSGKFNLSVKYSRRLLVQRVFSLAPVILCPALAYATPRARKLRLVHTHTGESLAVTYCENGEYLPDALVEINTLLRDFRSGEICPIEPALLDFVHDIQLAVGKHSTSFEIISAYRSPATNEMLRQTSSGVARKSFHTLGQALDIRLQGVDTQDLRQIAVELAQGGVGYYPQSDFLHIDMGPVRQW